MDTSYHNDVDGSDSVKSQASDSTSIRSDALMPDSPTPAGHHTPRAYSRERVNSPRSEDVSEQAQQEPTDTQAHGRVEESPTQACEIDSGGRGAVSVNGGSHCGYGQPHKSDCVTPEGLGRNDRQETREPLRYNQDSTMYCNGMELIHTPLLEILGIDAPRAPGRPMYPRTVELGEDSE